MGVQGGGRCEELFGDQPICGLSFCHLYQLFAQQKCWGCALVKDVSVLLRILHVIPNGLHAHVGTTGFLLHNSI